MCHLGGFASFLLLYFASVIFSSKTPLDQKQKPSILSDILNNLDKDEVNLSVITLLPENQVILANDNGSDIIGSGGVCSLYIADSSLPNSGFGVFSMKSIKAGDVVVPQSKTFDVAGVQMSSYMMFIKQHGLGYDNVKGGIDGSEIVASKDIGPGDELFFKLEDYNSDFKVAYHSLHPNDPTKISFEQVDSISKKIIGAIPIRKIENKPKKKQYKQKTKRTWTSKPSMDATAIFGLFKDTLIEYDTNLANLLPSTHSEAQSMLDAGGRAMYITNKRSPEWLVKNGVCVDGLRPTNSGSGAVTTRPVLKGDVISTSPLYATLRKDDHSNCFCSDGLDLMLCQLSFSSHISEGLSSSQCSSDDRNDCPHNVANAHYQFSKFNKLNENLAIHSRDHLLKVSSMMIILD